MGSSGFNLQQKKNHGPNQEEGSTCNKRKPMTLDAFWVQPTRKETNIHQYYRVQL